MKVFDSCCRSRSLQLSRMRRRLEACWLGRAWQSRGRTWETSRGIFCYGPSRIAVSSLWRGTQSYHTHSCLYAEGHHLPRMIPSSHVLAASNVSSCFVVQRFYFRRIPSRECCLQNVQQIVLASKMISPCFASLLTWSTFLIGSCHSSLVCCGAQSSAQCHGVSPHLLTIAIVNCYLHGLFPTYIWPNSNSHVHPG